MLWQSTKSNCCICEKTIETGAMVVVARVGIVEHDGCVRLIARVKLMGDELQLDNSRFAETVIICSPECGQLYFSMKDSDRNKK
jgi:hypothetical protein